MKVLSLALLSALMMTGCAGAQFASKGGMGFIYRDSVEANAVTSSPDATKKGEACTTNILGLVNTGDASADAAKKNGGITTVSSSDDKYFNILGIYSSYCSVVRGK
jgi:hypothetical protein